MAGEKQRYRRDNKKIQSTAMKHLAAKVTIGGNVGGFAMVKLAYRDSQMNKDVYMEARKEREAIKARKTTHCNLCGGYKYPGFKICYKCHKSKELKN
jgi:hypothetical protein